MNHQTNHKELKRRCTKSGQCGNHSTKHQTVAKQAEAPLSLTANLASQYNFMHCWQVCLRRFVQAINFSFSGCLDHFTCFTSFIFMSHIIRYWLLPFGCIRPSRPIGSVLPLQLLNGFRFDRFFKVGFGQNSCSSRPRAQSRNGDFVAGSCDWWLEAERSCTTSKNTEIDRTKWNQMESNGIRVSQSH